MNVVDRYADSSRLRAAGDLVVEQPPAGLEQGVQVVGVLQVPLGADVFGHTDGGDRVVRPVVDVAVVLDADLDPVGEPLLGDPLAGVGGLLLGERDADDADAVLAGGVDRHGAPAAADVEQPLPGPQAELAADEVELVALGALQGAVLGLPVGARVHHRGAEDELVEVVADVVVVADGAPVACAWCAGRRRGGGSPPRGGAGGSGGPASATSPRAAARTSGSRRAWPRPRASSPALPHQPGHQVEGGVQVALDVQVAGDPGAGQPQFARLPQQAAQGTPVADDEGGRRRAAPPRDRPRRGCAPGAGLPAVLRRGLQPQRGISHGVHLRDAESRNVQHHVNTDQADPAVPLRRYG